MAKLDSALIIPDLHAPYHDARAFALMLKVGKALRPKKIVIMGDFMDCYCVSDHDKDPQRATLLKEELRTVTACLDHVDALGAQDKTFCGGNHDDRLRRYLQKRSPALDGLAGMSIPEMLHLRERGWTAIPYKSHVKKGKVHFTHDVGTAGRYAAYKALDLYQHSVVTAHTHRMSYIVEGNATGEVKLSCTLGWLGDASQIDYMHKQKVAKDWALGFGVGYVEPTSGHWFIQPIPIVHYRCVVNGVLYTG